MKIGDRIFVRGYIDEIRKDTVIIRNAGGYFGTIPSEVITGDLPSAEPEIVRCKECKWYELPSHKIAENCVRWMKSNCILLPIKPNDYCSYAERRTDATD